MNARLNIESLRRPPKADHKAAAALPLTRRGFLGLTGTAALAPLEGLLGRGEAFRFDYDGHVARFFVGNRLAWELDPSRFAGRPRLHVRENRQAIELRLSGSRLPGTPVQAGLSCLCHRGALGWWIRLNLEFGGFFASGPLVPWLLGETDLQASIPAGFELLPRQEHRISLATSGEARARFLPNWHLEICGKACGSAATKDWRWQGDHLRIGLPAEAEATLFEAETHLRSGLVLTRGGQVWDLPIPRDSLRGARLELDEAPFDTLKVETAEFLEERRIAFLARTGNAKKVVGSLLPGSAYLQPTGEELELPLRDIRFAGSFAGPDEESALLASLGPSPKWLKARGCRLCLGDDPDRAALEILRRNGVGAQFHCAPVLVASVLPLDGVLTETCSGSGSRVALIADPSIAELDEAAIGTCVCDATGALEVALPNCSVSVLRPEDLMVLRFEFRNLRLRNCIGEPPRLEPFGIDRPLVIVHFPPQHLAEQVFFEASTAAFSEEPTPPPILARVSGPSRLVFDPQLDPSGRSQWPSTLPFTLSALLNWDAWAPVRVPDKRCKDEIVAPTCFQTDIEFPYRLHLSPGSEARWRHAVQPVLHNGRYELWHSRLIRPFEEENPPTLRAVWSPDYGKTEPVASDKPFRMSLNGRDRYQLVQVTHAEHREPVAARLFLLSALGAWSDLEGNWPCDPRVETGSLERWLHVATMGRDQNVVIELRGFLFPLGHRATLVKQTERRITLRYVERDGVRRLIPIAYLKQRKFIQIKEPCREYSNWSMAWRRICFLETRSPNLNDPMLDGGGGVRMGVGSGHWGERAFWPTVGQEPYKFKVRTWDYAGNQEDREIPLIFVENSQETIAGCSGAVIDCLVADSAQDYANQPGRRTIPHRGAALALADSYRKGDTEVEAQNVVLTACLKSDWTDQPHHPCFLDPEKFKAINLCDAPFWPRIERVQARIPAVDHMVGNGGMAWFAPKPIAADEDTEVFADLVEGKISAGFHKSSDRSGGLLAPTPNIQQLSRRFGPGNYQRPAADSTIVRANSSPQLSPKDFFGKDAKILGEIALSEIVTSLDPNGSIPALLSQLTYYADGPDFLEQSLSWSTLNLRDQDFGLLYFLAHDQAGMPSEFTIEGSVRVWLGTDVPPAFDMTGNLKNFSIRLGTDSAGVLLEFPSLSYSAGNDRKPELDVQIGDVKFLGALAFIQELAKYLGDLLGNKSGIEIELQPGGVLVRFPPISFGVINVGAMSLKGLAITSWAKLPFTEAPVEFGLSFARPEAPCTLTIGIYGGRAYVTLILDTAHGGIRDMAAAFEFGVIRDLSFGPANGVVYVLAGIFYGVRTLADARVVEFRAYVRAGGNVDVLGLITAYIDLYIGLLAMDNGSESYLLGEATLTIGFKIWIFEYSATLRRQERIAGSKTKADSKFRKGPRSLGRPNPGAKALAAGAQPVIEPLAVPSSEAIQAREMLSAEQWCEYWAAFRGPEPCEARACQERL